MSTMTGSFRVADVRKSAFAPRKTTVASRGACEDNHGLPWGVSRRAAPPSRHDVGSNGRFGPNFSGLDVVAKWAQALKRPRHARKTAAEELAEERLNAVTHGLGLALSVAAVVYLLAFVMTAGGWLRVASCGVYGVSLLLMYAASTSLHVEQRPHLKRRFQLFDHVAIYLLIAGTYTPFLASLMQGYVGFGLLACVWTLAGLGIAIKLKNADRLGDTSPLPCLALGWLVLVAIKPLLAVLPAGGVVLLVAGGISYSIGMIFYCRDDKPYFHVIWHLFVMAGTAFHFAVILLYVGTPG